MDRTHVVACMFKDKVTEQRDMRTVWNMESADLAVIHIDERFDHVFELSEGV